MPQQAPATRHIILIALVLVLAVFAAFSPTLGFGIVNYDDDLNLTNRPAVSDGLTPANVRWAFTTFDSANYHPLTWVSYQLDSTFWGTDYRRFHATNVALHATMVVLLFWFLTGTTGSLWRSAAVAVLFALHPTRVESVAWLSERKDVLCGALAIAALIAYTHYARRPSVLRLIGFTVLGAMAMLSKPMIVTWPAVMLLMDVWPLRRVGPIDSGSGAGSGAGSGSDVPALPTYVRATPLRLVLEKLPLMCVSIGVSVATFLAQNRTESVVGIEHHGIAMRLASSAVNYVRYLGLTFWPVDLVLPYPYQSVVAWQAFGALVILATITVLTIRVRREKPYVLIGWLWFLGTLVPVNGVVRVGVASIADRYMYIPQIGLLIAIVWGIADALPARFRAPCIALTLTLAVALGVGSWRQSQHWRDSVSLWSHTLSLNENNLTANTSLAAAYLARGDEAHAMKYIIKSAQLAPSRVELQNTAGRMLMNVGQPEQAATFFRVAAYNKNNAPGSYVNSVWLIKALRISGKTDEAERELRALLNDPAVPRTLVEAEFDLDATITKYRAHLAAHPDDAVARNVLGVALARSGDLAGAAEQFAEALRINPGMSDARDNLERAQRMMITAPVNPAMPQK